jgi:hypothetical protein
MKLLLLFSFLFFPLVQGTQYQLKTDPIDVMIPCHEKDLPILELCIEGIRENGENIGNVYVISKKRFTDKAEWVDPFTKSTLTKRIFGEKEISKSVTKYLVGKVGWVYQQLLKLYVFRIVPILSSNVLILDADTVFINPVSFLTEKGLNYKHEEKIFYIRFIHRFLPNIICDNKPSGITHHMIFQKPVIEDLFSVVEAYHQTSFWEAFCNCTKFTIPKWKEGVYPTEYGTYFNFIFSHSVSLFEGGEHSRSGINTQVSRRGISLCFNQPLFEEHKGGKVA